MVILIGIGLFLNLVAHLWVESLWFQEVGYLQVFLLQLTARGGLWAISCSVSASYLLGNLAIARKLTRVKPVKDLSGRSPQIELNWLLPLILALNLLVGILLFHYIQVGINYWHDANSSLAIPRLFTPESIWQTSKQLSPYWYFGLVGGLAIALSVYPQFLLNAIATLLSLIMGVILSAHWAKLLQYIRPTAFNSSEPVFNRDISFYIFALPIWKLLEFWLVGLCLYSFVSVALTYLQAEDSVSQGRLQGLSLNQQRHLLALGSASVLVVAFGYWLSRYELLYSNRGVAYGASYTDVNFQLPAYTVLSLIALAIAFLLLWQAIFSVPKTNHKFLFTATGIYAATAIASSSIFPLAIQRLIVQPNELARERPYIERSIALTRLAFDLENIDARTFNPQGQLTYADIQANDLTIRNIRLWDQRPLLETNRQLQQIRLYYQFPDADIDRYTLKANLTAHSSNSPAVAERQQTLIAARELDYSAVPQQAQTWVNQRLIYTHGYGFTLSPVNTVGAGGLPEYFVKDIGDTGNGSSLSTSNSAIASSIPIGQPRIYYGEITNTYVMTGTRVQELDYPSGNDNVYNTYDGRGGINIGSWWQRSLFAAYLKDWQMLLTRNFLPQTKVLFRRNITQRIRAIAPFLQYDRDPYLVVADTQIPENKGNYLYWIVDAYTTSDRYPYSDTGAQGVNYIRNSVKVVVDAYHGSVDFYVADPQDPIITTWQKLFPRLFKPLNQMPASLRSHLRYPVDFFKLQAERLMTYHMIDPQVFYNREDQWQIPNEVYGNKPQLVEPYYLITSLPTVPFEEFILLLPYTPSQRTNLIAWLAARSDGENYGKLLLYEFPKQQLVYGPEQIEARINQDPVISQQISLWNRQGSRAIQGNLLVVPIEQSLLYVEPIYLEADQNSLPTLVRVVVAYENRIVMAETLEQALQAIFQAEETNTPAIVRPVEEPTQ
ncbi:hypothetical protein UH38_08060 [Aliterella atlantica CENA595]|uniref:UPF0182 protein UH38_08060 n=1 Tax=Aliterella atlantica CENA595 TaxID=1618023 RepID=A0A0D8ZV95_9CYAN|nr:hypothetical protein UH38_08060 [Aliterella atlantica CENA595]